MKNKNKQSPQKRKKNQLKRQIKRRHNEIMPGPPHSFPTPKTSPSTDSESKSHGPPKNRSKKYNRNEIIKIGKKTNKKFYDEMAKKLEDSSEHTPIKHLSSYASTTSSGNVSSTFSASPSPNSSKSPQQDAVNMRRRPTTKYRGGRYKRNKELHFPSFRKNKRKFKLKQDCSAVPKENERVDERPQSQSPTAVNKENVWEEASNGEHYSITTEESRQAGVQILLRGDIIGAFNCLWPQLQLERSENDRKIPKLDEHFSLFSTANDDNDDGLITITENGHAPHQVYNPSASSSSSSPQLQGSTVPQSSSTSSRDVTPDDKNTKLDKIVGAAASKKSQEQIKKCNLKKLKLLNKSAPEISTNFYDTKEEEEYCSANAEVKVAKKIESCAEFQTNCENQKLPSYSSVLACAQSPRTEFPKIRRGRKKSKSLDNPPPTNMQILTKPKEFAKFKRPSSPIESALETKPKPTQDENQILNQLEERILQDLNSILEEDEDVKAAPYNPAPLNPTYLPAQTSFMFADQFINETRLWSDRQNATIPKSNTPYSTSNLCPNPQNYALNAQNLSMIPNTFPKLRESNNNITEILQSNLNMLAFQLKQSLMLEASRSKASHKTVHKTQSSHSIPFGRSMIAVDDLEREAAEQYRAASNEKLATPEYEIIIGKNGKN